MYFLIFLLLCCVVVAGSFLVFHQKYLRSPYFQCTKLPYREMREDSGRYGEYLVYKYLSEFERFGAKFLFNAYIPKQNGETSEIDVLMLCTKGIFVIESKNYSGWIFGNENQKMWYQTLPTGRGKSHKEEFYNPIFQNYNHIKNLKSFIGDDIPMWSIIAFSDRCTLKNICLRSKYIHVINRYDIEDVVGNIWNRKKDVLSDIQIDALYTKLFPLTQVDKEIKQLHLQKIKNKFGNITLESSDEDDSDIEILSEIEKILGVEDFRENMTIEEKQNAELSEIQKILHEPIETEQTSDNNENNHPKCPRCGNDLIVRTVNRGDNKGKRFYGCSAYPKCRFTKNITD